MTHKKKAVLAMLLACILTASVILPGCRSGVNGEVYVYSYGDYFDPMVAEEAVLQMDMLGHDFFVFLDMDTNAVSVVYKRKGGEYGLIETDR